MTFILCGRHSIWWSWRVAFRGRFCVAGAVFGEVGVWLFVAGAALRDITGDSRSAKCCIFQYKIVSKDRTGKVSEAAGARWRFYRIVFLLAEALQGVSAEVLSLKISWQAQYLVSLKGDFTCALDMTFHMWPQPMSPQIMVCLVREFSPKWPSIKLSCPDTYMILYIAQIHCKNSFPGHNISSGAGFRKQLRSRVASLREIWGICWKFSAC